MFLWIKGQGADHTLLSEGAAPGLSPLFAQRPAHRADGGIP